MEFQGSGLVTFDVEEKLKQLSVAEKVDLLSGQPVHNGSQGDTVLALPN